MKKYIIMVVLLVANIFLAAAQPPNKMNYQAVVRGSDGNVWANKTVGLQISILQGSETGPVVFAERHTITTNANGLVTVVIGTGSIIQGTFSTINWANGPFFLKTETDLNGGTAYTITGTKQLMSVPYALFAISSGTMSETDPIFGASPAKAITNADITNWNNKLDAEVDGSIQNELQTLTINGNQLSISKGNTVTLPTGEGAGDQWGSQVVASDETLTGDGTLAHPLGVDVAASAFNNWDKDVSDDFSGDYEDLTNAPVTFYEIGGTEPPDDINDNMYHTGNVVLGDDGSYNNTTLKVINKSTTAGRYHCPISTLMDINGSANHISIINQLSGSGTGKQTNIYNVIDNDNDTTHIGVLNALQGSGSGNQYGIMNLITNSGDGKQYCVYNKIDNSGGGVHYGVYNYLSSRRAEKQYGIYNKINITTPGMHYAVYGEAEKQDSSYAGYFKGDVYVSRRLKGIHSGSADMKAYIYGRVRSNGELDSNACSDGFAVERVSTGRYKISFDNDIDIDKYLVVGSAFGTTGPAILTYSYQNNQFYLFIWNTSGSKIDCSFSFVVYKK
jgi:hypothetical protein